MLRFPHNPRINDPLYMTQLTQEHFDKHITKLALQTDLDELKESVESVESTLDTHTGMLDKVVKNTQDWKTEQAAHGSAHKMYDRWFKQIAEKIGIDLES